MPTLSNDQVNSRLEVRLHFRTLLSAITPDSDFSSINKKLKSRIRDSQELFLLHDILLRPVSYESLDLPALKVLDAAETGASDEQMALMQAFTPPQNEVAVFLVDTIVDSNGMAIHGCALPGSGAVMIAKPEKKEERSRWTFGHEMGHLLGIQGHQPSPQRLMYEDTTQIGDIALLVWAELVTMRSSSFAQPVL